MPGEVPGSLNDVTVTNSDATSATLTKGWFADFRDVPAARMPSTTSSSRSLAPARDGRLRRRTHYCPGNPVTRAQMAVLLHEGEARNASLRSSAGVRGGVFGDVRLPAASSLAWVEQLAG